MTSSGNKFRRLEEDFNDGDPIDLSQYRNVLTFTGSMGFTAEDAVEASLVLQTTDNLQQITDYLLSPEQEKQKSYMKRKAECQLASRISPEQEKRIDELKRLHREVMYIYLPPIPYDMCVCVCKDRYNRKSSKLSNWVRK